MRLGTEQVVVRFRFVWDRTMTRSKVLIATARATCAETLILRVRAQEVCGVRRLQGGSDADVRRVVDVITDGEGPLCTDCIASKTSLSTARVEMILAELRRHFRTASVGECDGCLTRKGVHRLGHSDSRS